MILPDSAVSSPALNLATPELRLGTANSLFAKYLFCNVLWKSNEATAIYSVGLLTKGRRLREMGVFRVLAVLHCSIAWNCLTLEAWNLQEFGFPDGS